MEFLAVPRRKVEIDRYNRKLSRVKDVLFDKFKVKLSNILTKC